MGLVGTLLLPCLALTRDLANAAAAFSTHSPRSGTSLHPADPVEASCPPPLKETNDGHCGAASNEIRSGASACAGNGTTAADSSSPPQQVPESVAPAAQQQQPTAGAVKAGTGLSRPILVTAMEFMSPYPLVMATSTGGAVVVWRTADCVCVQVSSNKTECSPSSRLRTSSACTLSGEHGLSRSCVVVSAACLLSDLQQTRFMRTKRWEGVSLVSVCLSPCSCFLV